MWRTWQPKFQWENLCPIHFADSWGMVVVMPWAVKPVTQDEIDAACIDYYPNITSEFKSDDFGRVDGKVLILDYGLSDAKCVHEQRACYRKHPACD
jgi:hypothetical protein